MSYIGLLNEESSSSNSSFVASTDYLTVGRAFTNYGVMTQLDNATFSGATGITTTALTSSGAVSGSQIQISGEALSTDNIPVGSSNTNKYYSSTLAQADAKIAISSTDSTEIDFTYTAGNITAILKDNTIDISRLKTSQISTANTANTLVLRDVSGNFSTGTITTTGITNNTSAITNNSTFTQIGAMKLGSAGTNIGSLNLYNATNTDYLQITTATGMSTISTNGTGVRQLALIAQTTNIYNALITAPISVRDAATMSSVYMVLNDTGINLTSGLNYKINGIEYLATKSTTNLIEGTNKYLNSLTTTSPNEITLTLATNNLSAQLKDTSIALSKLTSGGAFQMILCNGSGVPTYSSLTLNNLPYGLVNQFIQSNGTTNNWTTMSGDATLSSGVLTIGAGKITNTQLLNSSISLNGQVMSLGSTAYTLTTTNIAQGTNKYLNSLTTTSPNEITLTLATNNLSGSLIDNTIDISKIKTTQIDTVASGDTLVQRDATGSFGGNLISASSLNAGIMSLNYDGVHGTYLNATLNYSTSPYPIRPANNLYIDTDNHGTLYLNQNVASSVVAINGSTTMSGLLTANSGINIPTGQTYKINNASINTDNISDVGTTNKYLNNLTTTSPNEITLTLATNNLSASVINSSITNAKLANSTITLGSTSMSLGSTNSTISVNQMTGSLGTFGSPATATASIVAGTSGSHDGVLVLRSANGTNSTQGCVLQSQGGNLNIDCIQSNQLIQLGQLNNNDTVCNGLLCNGIKFATEFSPSQISTQWSGVVIPYFNVQSKRFLGSVTTSLISPNWARVTATNTMEVKIYCSNSTPTFLIQGQIQNYYVSTNSVVYFNVGFFRNFASTATLNNLLPMVNGHSFVQRNYNGGATSAFSTSFMTTWTPTGANQPNAGDYFTFTMYFQSATNMAGGSVVGRTLDDIPSVLTVTQIS